MLRSDRDMLPKSHSGRWLVVGLFVVGLIVLAGFFVSRYYLKTRGMQVPTTRPATRSAR